MSTEERIEEIKKVIKQLTSELNLLENESDIAILNEQIEEKKTELEKLEEELELSDEENVTLDEIARLNKEPDKEKLEALIKKTRRELNETTDKESRKNLERQIEYYRQQINDLKGKTAKKGSFGEKISCLVGQIDKRINNWWFGNEKKGEKRVKRVEKKRQDRYENLGSYAVKRGIGVLALGAFGIISLPLGGVVPIAVIAGAVIYGAAVATNVIGDLIRKGPKPVIHPKKITKGGYWKNLGKALGLDKLFGKRKNKVNNNVKENNRVANTNAIEVKELENDRNKQEMIANVKAVIQNMSYDNFLVNADKLKFVKDNYYDKVQNDLDKKTKDEYRKWNLILDNAEEFARSVTEKSVNKCNSCYEKLLYLCGLENISKVIPSKLLEVYNDLIKVVETENEKTNETIDKEEKANLYIEACLKKMRSFKLENTRESVKFAKQNILPLFSKIKGQMKDSTLYKEAYEEYYKFEKDVEFREKVFTFMDTMINDYNASELTYDVFKMLINDFNDLRNDEEYSNVFGEIIKNDEIFLTKFRSFLKRSRQFFLKDRIDRVDIRDIHNKSDYNKIETLVRMADGYNNRRSGNLSGVNKGLAGYQDTLTKLDEMRNIRSMIMSDYKMECTLTVAPNLTICASYVDYLGNEQVITLDTKYTNDKSPREFYSICRAELAKRLSVPVDKIGLKIVNEQFSFEEEVVSKGSRR